MFRTSKTFGLIIVSCLLLLVGCQQSASPAEVESTDEEVSTAGEAVVETPTATITSTLKPTSAPPTETPVPTETPAPTEVPVVAPEGLEGIAEGEVAKIEISTIQQASWWGEAYDASVFGENAEGGWFSAEMKDIYGNSFTGKVIVLTNAPGVLKKFIGEGYSNGLAEITGSYVAGVDAEHPLVIPLLFSEENAVISNAFNISITSTYNDTISGKKGDKMTFWWDGGVNPHAPVVISLNDEAISVMKDSLDRHGAISGVYHISIFLLENMYVRNCLTDSMGQSGQTSVMSIIASYLKKEGVSSVTEGDEMSVFHFIDMKVLADSRYFAVEINAEALANLASLN